MEDKKANESVKTGMQIAADTNPEPVENDETVPLTEGEKDLDDAIHERSTEGNIEHVDGEEGGEPDVDDLVHETAPQQSTGSVIDNNEEDIDDLMHKK